MITSAQCSAKYGPPSDKNSNMILWDVPENLELSLLGDLVICAPVLEKEAFAQNKALIDHWAHIIIHGVLHLVGYDHIDDDEAEIMETKEIIILSKLNIKNPYIQENE